MRLDFPYFIRKFLALKMYCENSLAKNSSLIFTIAEKPLFEFLKVAGSVLLKSFPKLSACTELLNCFMETDKSLFPFSEIILAEKSDFLETSENELIAIQ